MPDPFHDCPSIVSCDVAPPGSGDPARDFTLLTLGGDTVRLSDLTSRQPIVLVVLRGYPGYQCPYCNLQFQDFVQKSQGFAEAVAHMLLVYPGPPQDLQANASDFLEGTRLPHDFDLLLDPDYHFTNLYGLRWNEPEETAFPATFLIDRRGVIFFAKLAREHEGRTTAAEILDVLRKSSVTGQ